MKDAHPLICPLCDVDAEAYRIDGEQKDYIKCPNHPNVAVSPETGKLLATGPQSIRDELIRAARTANEDEFLLLRRADWQERDRGVGPVVATLELKRRFHSI